MVVKKEKIGIFGGSFDPVHLGHFNLISEIQKKMNFDKIIVVPVAISPLKKKYPPIANDQDRLAMLQLCFEKIRKVVVSDIELNRGGNSYTIDTVKFFLEKYRNAEFYLLMAEDVWLTFEGWKDSEELKKIVSIVVLTQDIRQVSAQEGVSFVEIPWIALSSTMIREKLSKKENCKNYISLKVLDYINLNCLYS